MFNTLKAAGNKVRDHKRELMLLGALGGATVLNACGTVSEDVESTTFVVGVECAGDTQAKIESVSDVVDPIRGANYASISVVCGDEAKNPISMQLLDGPDTLIIQDGAEYTNVEIDVSFQQGGGFDGTGDQDPAMELDASLGDMRLTDLRAINRVEVI